jgi:hypothetical protein
LALGLKENQGHRRNDSTIFVFVVVLGVDVWIVYDGLLLVVVVDSILPEM